MAPSSMANELRFCLIKCNIWSFLLVYSFHSSISFPFNSFHSHFTHFIRAEREYLDLLQVDSLVRRYEKNFPRKESTCSKSSEYPAFKHLLYLYRRNPRFATLEWNWFVRTNVVVPKKLSRYFGIIWLIIIFKTIVPQTCVGYEVMLAIYLVCNK